MKEKIYTIPVTEAFGVDCECPMCVLEKRLEDESIDYMLGPSLMEPDGRMETNDKGFCRRHFQLLYNKQANRLGLGLIIDTHLCEQNEKLRSTYEKKIGSVQDDSRGSLLKNLSGKLLPRSSNADESIDKLLSQLTELENKCAVCNRLDHTMDRYIDVILYLWFKEPDFRNTFNNTKGFCLKHLRQLIEGSKKYLGSADRAEFVRNLLDLQLKNMTRIQQEVNWFTRKFDYRNSDAPWSNSKDAIIRSIQKIVGFCELK